MLADLAEWLRKESQYVRLRAAATGKTLEQTLQVVGAILDADAHRLFPSVDAFTLLIRRVWTDRDLPDLSYQMIQEMRIAIASGGMPPLDPTPAPPNQPPPRPAAPAMVIIEDEPARLVDSKVA